MKKIRIGVLVILILGFLSISFSTFGAKITVDKKDTTFKGTYLELKSEADMYNIKIYKKANDGKFILFYQARSGGKEKKIFISRLLLSTEAKTEIKVVAEDKEGNRMTGGTTVDVIPTPTSINPSETATPSWTSSPIPTFPTPTISPSTTTKPTTSTTVQPTTSTRPTQNTGSGENVAPTGLTLNKTEVTLTMGKKEKDKLVYTLTPANAKAKLTWRTYNKDVVMIEKDGTITAKGGGTTEVSIRTDTGLEAKCKVTVMEEYGETLAKAACRLAYSNYCDQNGKDLCNDNGYYGTAIYKKYRDDGDKPHGCCSRGMYSVINAYLKYDTDLEKAGAKEQYYYMAKSSKWKKIGTYESGMEDKADTIMQPGDIVISNHHTCMYVGNKIPTQVYNESLKGTDADYGTPAKDRVWVSGSWNNGINLSICNRGEAHPSSGDGIIYRYVGNK